MAIEATQAFPSKSEWPEQDVSELQEMCYIMRAWFCAVSPHSNDIIIHTTNRWRGRHGKAPEFICPYMSILCTYSVDAAGRSMMAGLEM